MDPVAIPFAPIGIEPERPQGRFLGELMRYLEGFWPKLANRVNATFPKDGSEAMTGPLGLPTYTIATLPTASEYTGGIIYVSDGLPFSGALLSKSSTQAITTVVITNLIWQTERYDEGDWFASSGDNFFTVPTGVTRVRLSGSVHWQNGVGTYRLIGFSKNAASAPGLSSSYENVQVLNFNDYHSPVVEVVAGDVLRMFCKHNHGSNRNVNANNATSFGVEAVSWYSNVMVSDGTNWSNF